MHDEECEDLHHDTWEGRARRTAIHWTLLGVSAVTAAIALFGPDRSVPAARASGMTNSSEQDVYARLPAYPRPFTDAELRDVNAQLTHAGHVLDATRAATDQELARMKDLAQHR